MKKEKLDNLIIYYNDIKDLALYDNIKNKNYCIIKVLKDDDRSYVALIKINNIKLVYKIPKEKNRRKWQRFLSFFRGSQSKREFLNIELIKSLGFNCSKPLLAVEYTKMNFVVDSYFLYSYLEGHQSTPSEALTVSDTLTKIHDLGYLHGDSQLENFIIGTDGLVYLIDTKFVKNPYGGFGRAYEFIYLEESCHNGISLYNSDSFYYKGAMLFKKYLIFLDKLKKTLKNKKD